MRRAGRRWPWPVGVAAAALLAVAAGATLQGGDGPDLVDPGPAAVSGPGPGPGPGPGIWPFTSASEAAAAPPDSPYRDPEFTARAFAREYLGIADELAASAQRSDSGFSVTLRRATGEGGNPWPDAPPMTVAALIRLDPGGPWTVVAARAPRIEPGYALDHGLEASSPVRLQGRANAYEGTVQVEVREDAMVAGQALGRGFVTGSGDSDGSLRPFDGEVSFRPPTRAGGAVVLYEASAATGGGLLQVTVVRISFARP